MGSMVTSFTQLQSLMESQVKISTAQNERMDKQFDRMAESNTRLARLAEDSQQLVLAVLEAIRQERQLQSLLAPAAPPAGTTAYP